MKTLKTLIIFLFCGVLLFSSTSCVVLVSSKDNGLHKGWFKNTNNPHNPQSTKQNKSQGNSKK